MHIPNWKDELYETGQNMSQKSEGEEKLGDTETLARTKGG